MTEKTTDPDIQDICVYHPCDADQIARISNIREKAMEFMQAIRDNCPESPDRTTAMRSVREALLWGNASIALNGKSIR